MAGKQGSGRSREAINNWPAKRSSWRKPIRREAVVILEVKQNLKNLWIVGVNKNG